MRGSAREEALRTLYEADQRAGGTETEPPAPGGGRAGRIVRGVLAEREELDEALEAVSTNWRVDRMPPIDRALLRIGLWELRNDPTTSIGTVIDEAVELAKRYSTEQSGRFVNGVLATLASRERPSDAAGGTDAGG
ncbi:MAG: transcription antitermination factor NusB [Acidimicrobiia bacterium]|nr:transcription antitermination factor NusB [Acidimicrobiia bacterium]NNL14522.1 transcription antitermination factor NusB [Acidimicrobiia bacterium]RZV47023.1 MAG: transcription antitermination factor NusB [Acidimicrobiia bacterium]